MALPLATTTVRIERTAGSPEPYEAQTVALIAHAVPAVISAPTGSERRQGGSSERVDAVLNCDPCGIANADQVTDLTTGVVWRVVWSESRRAMGLDHETAGLLRTTGVGD